MFVHDDARLEMHNGSSDLRSFDDNLLGSHLNR